MIIKPIGNHILLEIEELKKVSKVYVPDQKTKKQYRVLACKRNENFKVGDLVIFDASKGQARELNQRKYILIDQKYIIGIIKGKK